MVFFKAGKNNAQIKEWGAKFMVPCAFGVSALLAIVFHFFLSPYLQRRVEAKIAAIDDEKAREEEARQVAWAGIEDMDEHTKATGTRPDGKATERTERQESDDGSDVKFGDEETTTGENKDNGKESISKSQRLRGSVRKSMSKLGDATINRDIEAQAFEASVKAKEMWTTGENFDAHTGKFDAHIYRSVLRIYRF